MTKVTFSPSEWFTGLVVSALAYGALFYINSWLTDSLTYGLGVNWIYLPAGLRLFMTLIFGLSGAIGIAFASFAISYLGALPQDLTLCIGTGVISGFAPYLARIFILSNTKLEPDLSNLNFPKLIVCILLYALLSSGLHQFWFATLALDNAGTVNHFLVMFAGDIFGSLLLISAIKCGLDLLRQIKQRAH